MVEVWTVVVLHRMVLSIALEEEDDCDALAGRSCDGARRGSTLEGGGDTVELVG